MSVLANIVAYKRSEVAQLRTRFGHAGLEERAASAGAPRGFASALKRQSRNGYGLIAELKKASPSRGLIRADFDPAGLARAYAAGGAACLSVLTDKPSFRGSGEFLTVARDNCTLPVLRKDFMIDPLQVLEARALGADCILIIVAILSNDQAAEIEAAALELGMDVLIEVHDESELERASSLRSRLLGINNRNLRTFEVSLATTLQLLPQVPADYTVVSESGLFSSKNLSELAAAGVRCFLVGESLMREADVEGATRRLIRSPLPA
ncbi:MAG: indole-3-glycerol phosphate synthase TrpC [Rhodobacteraceae bacterium]|nr:indole-3-glycerol phosphate synthase TrpC [Paracoccaceae bacterium]